MKTIERTKCPVCKREVGVNPRTFSIRKHRLDGQKSQVCAGSNRLYLRPASQKKAEFTLFVGGKPVLTTPHRAFVDDLDAQLLTYSRSVAPTWRDTLITDYDLPHGPSPRVMWSYLPDYAVSSALDAVYHVRSRTCTPLVAVHIDDEVLASALRTELEGASEFEGDLCHTELMETVRVLDNPRTWRAPPVWDIHLDLASALIRASGVCERIYNIDSYKLVWHTLTYGKLPSATTEEFESFRQVLAKAEDILVRARPTDLRTPLATLIDMQDTVHAITPRHKSC